MIGCVMARRMADTDLYQSSNTTAEKIKSNITIIIAIIIRGKLLQVFAPVLTQIIVRIIIIIVIIRIWVG